MTQPYHENFGKLAFSINETAELLGLSRPSIYRLMASGDLRFIYALKKRLVPASAIDVLLGNTANTTQSPRSSEATHVTNVAIKEPAA